MLHTTHGVLVVGRSEIRCPTPCPFIVHTDGIGNGNDCFYAVGSPFCVYRGNRLKAECRLNTVATADIGKAPLDVQIGGCVKLRIVVCIILLKAVIIYRGSFVDGTACKNMVFLFQFFPSMRDMRGRLCGFFLEVLHIDRQAFRIWIDICVNLNQQLIERRINIMHLAQAFEIGCAILCGGIAADSGHGFIEFCTLFLRSHILQVQRTEVTKAEDGSAIIIFQFRCRCLCRFGAEVLNVYAVLIGQRAGGNKDDKVAVLAVCLCNFCQLLCDLQTCIHTGGTCVPRYHFININDILCIVNAHKDFIVAFIGKIAFRHLRQGCFFIVTCDFVPFCPTALGMEVRSIVFTGIIACVQAGVLG